jgi:hypothetical protein
VQPPGGSCRRPQRSRKAGREIEVRERGSSRNAVALFAGSAAIPGFLACSLHPSVTPDPMSVCLAGRFKPLWPLAPRNSFRGAENVVRPPRAVSLSLRHRTGLFRSLLSRGFGDHQRGTKRECSGLRRAHRSDRGAGQCVADQREQALLQEPTLSTKLLSTKLPKVPVPVWSRNFGPEHHNFRKVMAGLPLRQSSSPV